MKNIIIVGGGTAGYVSALILKTRFKDINIKIIKSNKIGIIGVGEGSTEHWKEFLRFVGINEYNLIKKTDATLKCGIMFKGWSEKDYLHSVLDELTHLKFGQTLLGYQKLISLKCDQKKLNNPLFWDNKVAIKFLENNIVPANQYHFNTFKLNEFLEKESKLRLIKIVDDEILNVEIKNNNIIKLKGEKSEYVADLFIDCTGFKKLLISKLGAKWQSYKKYLKMKEAIAFPTEDTEEYNIYTVAQAMNYGWMFQIPTYGRQGNGYIFDSDYINADQAKEEVEKFLNKKIEVGKHIKFDPGCLDKVWINNCVAIGLSANFVEPLEATSIGTSIQQVFLLMHYLPKYNQENINFYNNQIDKIMTNIRDFIILHYITDKKNTEFWKNLKKIEIPDSLKINLEKWKTRLPIREDFMDSNYLLFFEYNWIHILYGLNLINENVLKESIKLFPNDWLNHVDQKLDLISKYDIENLGHKEYLNIIRNNE
jgi:flavin-dependent dehydrogenase